MLKIENVKKLLVLMLAVVLLGIMQLPVKATSPIPTNTTSNTASNNTIQTIPSINNGSTAKNTTNTTNNIANKTNKTNTTNNTNNSSYSKSNLPHAGIDYSVLFVIAACVILGVYAYIKIRDYNDINY